VGMGVGCDIGRSILSGGYVDRADGVPSATLCIECTIYERIMGN